MPLGGFTESSVTKAEKRVLLQNEANDASMSQTEAI